MTETMPTLRHSAKAQYFLITYYLRIDSLIHLFLMPFFLDLFVRTDTLEYPITEDISYSFCITSLSRSFSIGGFSFLSCPLTIHIALVSVFHPALFHPFGLPFTPISSINSFRLKAIFYSLTLPPELLFHISNTGMNISAWRLHW